MLCGVSQITVHKQEHVCPPRDAHSYMGTVSQQIDERLTCDDTDRLKHAQCAQQHGRSTCSNHRGSSCASFNMSQSGHQKPWRAKTRYLAFLCPFLLSLFSSYRSSLRSLSPFVSLFHSHAVSTVLSEGNQFLQCPPLTPRLILLSTCLIKEPPTGHGSICSFVLRQPREAHAHSLFGFLILNQCSYLRAKCMTASLDFTRVRTKPHHFVTELERQRKE